MKPYTRGDFRVLTRKRANGSNHYQIQVYIEKGDSWLDFGCPFDYLGNARQRVRNLYAACCTHREIAEFVPSMPSRYLKTGKQLSRKL